MVFMHFGCCCCCCCCGLVVLCFFLVSPRVQHTLLLSTIWPQQFCFKMAVVDETQFIRVLGGVGSSSLIHRGTGESRRVDWHCLGKDHGDRVLLVPLSDVGTPVWASTLLEWRLFETLGESPRQYMVHTETGDAQWMDMVRDSDSRSYVWGHSLGSRRWLSEVFISKLPRGEACVRWSLKDLIEDSVGSDRDGRWITLKAKAFAREISRVYPDAAAEDHLRPSHRAVRARAAHRLLPPPSIAELQEYDSDFSVSTQGMLIVCAYLHGSRLKCEEDVVDAVSGIVEMIVDRFIGESSRTFWLEDGDNTFCVTIRHRCLVIQVGRLRCLRTLSAILKGESVPLHDAMFKLFAAIGLKKFDRYPWLRCLFLQLLSCVAAEVESARDNTTMWSEFTHVDLPIRCRTSSQRTRAMNPSCKVRIVQLIEKEPGVSDARHIYGAMNILRSSMDARNPVGKSTTKHKRRFGVVMKKDACRNLQYTEAAQYNAVGIKTQNGSLFANIGFDGSAKGGTSWTLIAAWNADAQKGWWLPPQAASSLPCL
jgi:hypothetical protein